ncbi:DUF6090 family protein [Aestuariivivens sediminis]|uniref:DUF6090 family protein n=1 Tax=Aestuariivivens sediminis TaxID=2913557 RepID=UPI001F58C113|nr:DUF6090 family protein [Aestuariivivens sediminis]
MIKFFKKIRQSLIAEGKTVKYFKYAIGEIVLVVIGILIALQINNWNTERINNNRVKQYSKSLIRDLENDIEMINVSQFQAKKSFKKIDSLKSYILSTDPAKLSNTNLFVLTHDIMYRPFMWNRSTFNEMKNSEIIHNFKNDNLKKKLMAYESFSYHLDEDFDQDMTNAHKAEEITSEIMDLNNPYFSQMLVLESERFNDPTLDLFKTVEYQKAKKEDRVFQINNVNDLKKFVNVFIRIQDSYRIRAFQEMNEIKENAKEIIKLLKNESK